MTNSFNNYSPTRGYGLLEKWLAKKRANIANRLIPSHLKKGRVLDIGCGQTPYFLLTSQFRESYGLDRALAKIQLPDPSIKLFDFDLEKNRVLPFQDNFFETVTLLAVFEHLEPASLPQICQEIRRVLKPQGKLVLTLPTPIGDSLQQFLAKLRIVSPLEIAEHKAKYPKAKVVDYLLRAGFAKEKIDSGHFHLFFDQWITAQK